MGGWPAAAGGKLVWRLARRLTSTPAFSQPTLGPPGQAGEEERATAEPGAGAGEEEPEGAGEQEAGPGAGSLLEEGCIQIFYRLVQLG